MAKFYLDTYAIVEYLTGNEVYGKYLKGASLITCKLNLMELYYVLLRDSGESNADNAYLAFRNYETPIEEVDIKQAMKFRLRMKARKSDFSYADAIGYAIAQRVGVLYLTGDDHFRSLSGVEFHK